MNETLKAAGSIGAELGAARAEIEKLRGLLREAFDALCDGLEEGPMESESSLADRALAFRIKDALSQQAEPALAAVPDSGDAFYAGLYKKSAPMWHRLHDLAVSKGYDHVRFAIECAPVYKCDCMGARKVAIDMEGNTIPCECVAAANEAEPAPAQDERTAFEAWVMQHNTSFREDYDDTDENAPEDIRLDRQGGVYIWANAEAAWFAWKARSALDTRPAQTEQQPVCWASSTALAKLRNGRNNSPCVLTDGPAEFNDTPLFAAPVAQTAPQPEQRGLVDAVREAVVYLDSNGLNSIASGSTCHRRMRNALSATPSPANGCEGGVNEQAHGFHSGAPHQMA